MADKIAFVEALYRFAADIDLRDPTFLSSSLADDATINFSPAAAKLGFEYPLLRGKEAIVATLSASLGLLLTTHSVSNPHVALDGDEAYLDALVEAQYVPRDDTSRQYCSIRVCA
jgi:hypothetical protein